MLTNVITRFITRDINALVAFFHKLEVRLEAFLAAHDAEITAIKADIEQVKAYAKADIASIEATAEDLVQALEDKIWGKTSNAAVAAAIKASLPTTTNVTPAA